MIRSEEIVVFCGAGRVNRIAKKVLNSINILRLGQKNLGLSNINFSSWPDGEPDDRIANPAKINGKHVIFFVNSHEASLVAQALQLMWAIKHQYGALSLTVVMPFMSYRRQDHPEKSREIHRNLWFVRAMKDNRVDRLIVCDIHSDQTSKNAEDVGIKFYNVDPTPAYIESMSDLMVRLRGESLRVLVDAPDKGSLPRAALLAKGLELPLLVNLENFKSRLQSGDITMDNKADEGTIALIEEIKRDYGVEVVNMAPELVKGAVIIIREDELDTGGTAAERGRLYRDMGAVEIYMAVTHMVLSPGWRRKIADDSPYAKIFGGNTIYRSYEKTTGGLIIDVDMSLVMGFTLNEVINQF